MNNDYKIKEGDRVCVYLLKDVVIVGEVKYTPCATGDSWHILGDTGRLYYIQQFDFMEKL